MPYFLRTMRAGLPPVDAAPAYATLEAAMTRSRGYDPRRPPRPYRRRKRRNSRRA